MSVAAVGSEGATFAASPRLIAMDAMPAARSRVRIADLICVAIYLSIVANLGRIPVFSTGDREAPVMLNELSVAAVVAIASLGMLWRQRVRFDDVSITAMAFAWVGGASALAGPWRFGLTPFELLAGLAYLARWLLYFGLYVVIANCVRAADVPRIWRSLENMILYFAGFGILQSAFFPGFAQLVYPSRQNSNWDVQGRRLVSTVLEPNIAGSMIMLVLAVQLARIASGGRVPKWKPMLLLVALILTLSRSAALGLVVAGGVILAARGLSRRLVRLGALCAILALLFSPAIIGFAAHYGKFSWNGSASARLVGWASAIRYFAAHPVIGVGFNVFGFVQRHAGFKGVGAASYSTDGGLLFIATLTGVVGLAVYLAMLGLVIRRCRRVWRHAGATPDQRGLAIGVAAGLVGLCVDSFFVNSLLTNFVMEMLWICWGLVLLVSRELRTAGAPTETGSSEVPRLVGSVAQ